MPYTLRISKAAQRQFRKLPKPVQNRLRPRIRALADDPRPPGMKKLSDEERLYRIRVGDYRIVYQIQDEILVVIVVRIGDRKDVYRRFG